MPKSCLWTVPHSLHSTLRRNSMAPIDRKGIGTEAGRVIAQYWQHDKDRSISFTPSHSIEASESESLWESLRSRRSLRRSMCWYSNQSPAVVAVVVVVVVVYLQYVNSVSRRFGQCLERLLGQSVEIWVAPIPAGSGFFSRLKIWRIFCRFIDIDRLFSPGFLNSNRLIFPSATRTVHLQLAVSSPPPHSLLPALWWMLQSLEKGHHHHHFCTFVRVTKR